LLAAVGDWGGLAQASYGTIAAWILGGLVPVGAVAMFIRARRGKAVPR
jgi:hypothetical protein